MATDNEVRQAAEETGWRMPAPGSRLQPIPIAHRPRPRSTLVASIFVVSAKMIKVVAPKHEGFLSDLRRQIPEDYRFFDRDEGAWKIREPHLATARDLTYAWYGYVHFGDDLNQMASEHLNRADERARLAEERARKAEAEAKRLADLLSKRPAAVPPASHSVIHCLSLVRARWKDDAALGVLPDASEAVVKAAYRALVMLRHPDRNRSSTASIEFTTIHRAYNEVKKRRGWA